MFVQQSDQQNTTILLVRLCGVLHQREKQFLLLVRKDKFSSLAKNSKKAIKQFHEQPLGKTKNKISAVLITFNEIINIDEVLTNVQFADEIIVVDSFSTDGTFEKLLSYESVLVYQRSFDNFPSQKNYALSLCKNDWVLFIDADERISDNFKKEVSKIINLKENPIVAYKSAFKYFIGKKRIRFSGMQTTISYRLFRKSKCEYDSNFHVHEKLIVNGDSENLENSIDHYSYRDIQHFKDKIFFYENLKAKELNKNNKVPNFFHFHIKPTYKFLNNYLIRLGILDGLEGIKICFILAQGVRHRFKFLKDFLKEKKKLISIL